MSSDTPKACIRSDAIISQVDSYSYELENPETGGVLKLDDTGYLVAEHFETGDLTVDEVVTSLKEQHHLKISKADVLDFLVRADALNLLETPLEELGIDAQPQNTQEEEYAPTGQIEDRESILKLYRSRVHRFIFSFSPKTWAVLLGVIFLMLIPWPYKVAGTIVVKPIQQMTVRTPVSGTLAEFYVSEGDRVEKGQILAQLDDYQSDIARKQTELARVKAELDKLETGATHAEINRAKKEADLSQKIFSQAKAKAERYRKLFSQNLISEQDFNEAIAISEIKQKEHEQALAQLDLIRGGTRPELIRAKKADLHVLELDLQLLKTLQGLRSIRSPLQGVVISDNLPELIGKKMGPGDPIIIVASDTLLDIEAVIEERDIASIQRGQIMNFKVHALPDETFETKVEKIAPIGELSNSALTKEGGSVFRIHCYLNNSEQKLRPGMTGVGRIFIETRPIGAFVFSRVIRHIKVNYVL